MIFNTSWFLVFFPAAFLVLALAPGPRVRLAALLALSAVFHYHFAGPAGVAPIIAMGAATYAGGLLVGRAEGTPRRRLFFAFLVVPVAGLVAYKYQGLLLGSLGALLGGPVGLALPAVRPPALPLAISFFTFEFVHYLTDVYKGSPPIRDPARFALFAIHFPSIVSGPIKRFQPFLAQLEGGLPRPRPEALVLGAGQAALGFAKKLVVADAAAEAISLVQAAPPSRTSVVLLVALLSVRILFDFSGYSDIAIGLSRMIGVELPPNFRTPYAARNIAEFWQRWHISLSSWIRDYLYVPLGGSRHGMLRRVLNLALTMFLCGLWHGAAWHFGVWGLYHGAGLGAHALWRSSPAAVRFSRVPAANLLSTILTVCFVAFGWLLFFYPLADVARFSRALWSR
ncbi:MAG: MBOAT family O-acyltransferase [Thermoanaerobaculia bacterium]